MLAPSSSPGRDGGSSTHRSRKTVKTPPGIAASTHQEGSDAESVSSEMGENRPEQRGFEIERGGLASGFDGHRQALA